MSSINSNTISQQNLDWKAVAKNLINKYEGDNNFKIYQDSADSLTANPNKYLTAPRGVLLTPYMQNYAKSIGYKGQFINNASMPKTIANALQDKYLFNMFDNLDKVEGFNTLNNTTKAHLSQLHYNANNVGTWPKLTAAIAKNNYNNIVKELKDSKAYKAEQERLKNKPNAVPRWRDSINVIEDSVKIPQPSLKPIAPINISKPVSSSSQFVYTINKGDTLDTIGKKHNISPNELMRLNNIKDPKKLQIGTKLNIPFYKKGSFYKLATSLKEKYANMIKYMPLASENIVANEKDDIEKPTKTLKNNLDIIYKKLYSKSIKENNKEASEDKKITNIDDVLEAIYTENKKYFPNGLNKDLYNGKHDELILLNYNNNPIGFIGKQQRDFNNYFSVGILPEYRGKGYAKSSLINYIKNNTSEDIDNYWTVNKENKASIALYNSLKKEGFPINLKIFS